MPAGSLTGIVLESDDLDSDIVRLAAHGVSVEGDMVEQPWGRSPSQIPMATGSSSRPRSQ